MERKNDSAVLATLFLVMVFALSFTLRQLNLQSKAYSIFIRSLPERSAFGAVPVIEPNDDIRIVLVVQALLLTLAAYFMFRTFANNKGIWMFIFIISGLETLFFAFAVF